MLLRTRKEIDSSSVGIWTRIVAQTLHERALLRGELRRAEAFQGQLQALAPPKGGDYRAYAAAKHSEIKLLLRRAGEAEEAMREARAFLKETEARRLPLESMKCLQALADASLAAENPTAALQYASRSCALAEAHQADTHAAAATVAVTAALLALGLGAQGSKALVDQMPIILRNAPLLVCGKAHLVLAKCQINEGSEEELRAALEELEAAKACFCELAAFQELEETLYLQVRVYHVLSMQTERNEASKSFAFVQRERAVSRREEETWGLNYGDCEKALEMELERIQEKSMLYQSQIMGA